MTSQPDLDIAALFAEHERAGKQLAANAGRGLMADLTPGVASALSPLVRRVVAPNPGLMTGPGTNTYLVGIDEVAVIDPGPDDPGHVDAIIGASMRERVRWVLLTHTHPDHWPAAASIAKRTGAEIAGFGKFPKADEVTLELDRVLGDGDTSTAPSSGSRCCTRPATRRTTCASCSRRSACCSPATTCSTARPPSSTRSAAATWSSTSRRSSGCARSAASRASAPGTAT